MASKTCIYVQYPNHPHASMRHACGTVLMKPVMNEERGMYSKRVYAVKSIKSSLLRPLNKPGTMDHLKKDRKTADEGWGDIYNGQL